MHKVHFSFWKNGEVWFYGFLDGIVWLGKVRRTRDESVIRAIAERGRAMVNSEAVCMLNFGLKQGQGGMYIHLDDAQYEQLNK